MTVGIQRWTRRLLIALLAALGWSACRGPDIGAPAEGTLLVSIGDNFFEPGTLTVALGGSVRWTNGGTALHSVVADSGQWQSDLLTPTSWFEVRFDSLGTFPYHCSLHQETGTVIAQ